jgi:hypothetical protein
MQLTHSLKGAWFQPLNLKCDLVSKFAYRYNKGLMNNQKSMEGTGQMGKY